MPRIKEHGALVDIISDGSVVIAPRSGKGTTHQGPFNAALDAGANDTYVIALTFRLASYMVGQSLWFKANTANTGAATLNVNGLGAKTIKKVAGGITTDLATNDIRAGQWVHVVYDGTNFQMLSTSGNAPDVAASILAASISDGDVTHAPDGNSVFDALALKVTGPGSATADAFTQFDGTTGKLVKSGVTLDTDVALAANSDLRLASQKAVKAYADTKQAAITPGAFIPDPVGAVTDTDDEARAAIAAILDLLIAKGIMAAS